MGSDPALEPSHPPSPFPHRRRPRPRPRLQGGVGREGRAPGSRPLRWPGLPARGAGVRAGCPAEEVPAPQEPELPHGGASHPEREQFRPGAGPLRRREKETPRSTKQLACLDGRPAQGGKEASRQRSDYLGVGVNSRFLPDPVCPLGPASSLAQPRFSSCKMCARGRAGGNVASAR